MLIITKVFTVLARLLPTSPQVFGEDNLPKNFPKKGFKFFENHNDMRFIKKRKTELEAWLQGLTTIDGVFDNPVLLEMLGVDRMLDDHNAGADQSSEDS